MRLFPLTYLEQPMKNNLTDLSVFSQSHDGLIPVSKSNPCLHCGKPDWCYSVGELTVCKRDAEPVNGWHRTNKRDKEGSYYYAPTQEKTVRSKAKKDYFYPSRDSQPLVKVTRIDNGDRKKSFFQYHWDGQKWVKGNPDEIKHQVPLYRYQEIRDAIAKGELIFIVEGEGVADTLWELGLAATTFIGGSGKYHAYGTGYKEDLIGASIILCPDRDEPGVKYMDKIAQDFPDAQWLYAPPSDFYWNHLPKSRGLDIGDWVKDGAKVADILGLIGKRNMHIADREISEEERLKLDLQLLLAETDPFKQVTMRKQLHARKYSDKQIDYLMGTLDSNNNKPKATVYSSAEFRKLEAPSIGWLFAGLLPAEGVTILGGDSGVGKTTLAYDAAAAVLFNEPFLGEQPIKTGSVLFVNSSGEMLISQMQDSFVNRGLFGSDNWELINDWDTTQLETLEARVDNLRPALVVVDSFAGIHLDPNFNEDSPQSRRIVTQLQKLSERYHSSIILIHHAKKDKDASGVNVLRGSGAIAAASSAVWVLKGEKDSITRILTTPKLRGALPRNMQLELDGFNGTWEVLQGNLDDAASKPVGDRILAMFNPIPDKRFETEEIIKTVGGDKNTIYKSLQRLVQKGLLFKRPSDSDYRRKVYGLVKKIVDTPPHTHSTPSPFVSAKSSETITNTELENSGQLLDNYWTDSGHVQKNNEVSTISNPDVAKYSSLKEDLVDNGHDRGGVCDVQGCTESSGELNTHQDTEEESMNNLGVGLDQKNELQAQDTVLFTATSYDPQQSQLVGDWEQANHDPAWDDGTAFPASQQKSGRIT